MDEHWSAQEVAVVIRARQIFKAKGLARDADVKKQIADAFGQLTHLSLAQKQQAWERIEQFLSPKSREESVTLKP